MRHATAVVGCALVAAVLAACGTAAPDDTPNPTAPTTTASQAPTSGEVTVTPPPAPTGEAPVTNTAPDDGHGSVTATGAPGPNEAELLGEGEVPGFALTGKGDLEMASAQAENVAAQIAAISVEPAGCDPLLKSLLTSPAAIYQALSFGSVQGFSSDTGQLMAEAIATGPAASALVVDTTGIEGCSAVTATQGGMQSQVTIEPIVLSLGDSASGAFVTQTINAGGDPITTVTASVSVQQGDSVLALTLTGQAADPATLKPIFESAATNAYNKAAPAL